MSKTAGDAPPQADTASDTSAAQAAGMLERGAVGFAASVPVHPADDGFFGPRSVTWRLTGDMITPLMGIRALLLQALHPLAMAGVDQHSSWRSDPGARIAYTTAYVWKVSVGDRATASAAAARVRKIHGYVQGTDPATGQPYRAADPKLLLWIHNALVDSQLACTRLFGSITPEDQDRYLLEQVAAAELIGIPPELVPTTAAALDAYFDAIRPELMCTPAAASGMSYLFDYLAAQGPGPVKDLFDDAEAGEMWQDISDAAIATLPDWAIDLFAERMPQIPEARKRFGDLSEQHRTEVRQLLGVLETAFLSEPGVLEARQRLQLRMRQAE
jgi:uncharacterized protein (DUF2236 family)